MQNFVEIDDCGSSGWGVGLYSRRAGKWCCKLQSETRQADYIAVHGVAATDVNPQYDTTPTSQVWAPKAAQHT